MREQFATAILATGTWQQLAPMTGPAPKPSAYPGLAHAVQGTGLDRPLWEPMPVAG